MIVVQGPELTPAPVFCFLVVVPIIATDDDGALVMTCKDTAVKSNIHCRQIYTLFKPVNILWHIKTSFYYFVLILSPSPTPPPTPKKFLLFITNQNYL
jgi:hypothetical protein